MGDLKTPFNEPAMPQGFDPGGDLPTARGNDPNIDMGGASGLQPIWNDMPVSMGESSETSNSVSGLPLHPDRFQPSETPPEPPSLEDRSPGTIDQK